METPKEILIEKSIKITATKVDLLALLIPEDRALNFTEIMNRLRKPCHKTSLYRILSVLALHDIVHRIVDSEGTVYFIYNSPLQPAVRPRYRPYFKCNFCGQVRKMVQLPDLPIETWFRGAEQIKSVYLLVEGRCATCSCNVR